MNYLKKNFPIFLLSGSLIFAGISLSPSAQGATATISSLQKEILTLKKQTLALQKDMRAVRVCIDGHNRNGLLLSKWVFRLANDQLVYEDDDDPITANCAFAN
jgi:hypothetical protein